MRDLVSGQKAVVLQFSTEPSPDSALIRWFSHSPYSHIDFVLPDGRYLGARLDGGVMIRLQGYATFTRIKRVRIETELADAIYAAALDQRGKPYDMRAIVAFAIPALAKHRNWRDPGQWICSEIGLWVFETAGFFKHPVSLPANRVTPGDLDLVLSPFAETIVERTGASSPQPVGVGA